MDALAKIMAVEEIKQLKARYFRTLDGRDWKGFGDVFCRDALFDCSVGFQYTPLGGAPIGPTGPITKGRDAILAWVKDAFADRTSCHHGHCHEITLDSDTEAHGVIAMEDFIFAPDRTTLLLHAAGHYHERYRTEEGTWRIAETKLTRLFNHPNAEFFSTGVHETRVRG